MPTLSPFVRVACRCVIGLAIAVPAQFAVAMGINVITWESAQNISGDSDVRTTGSLVVAFNLGADGVEATTVNTVPFAAFPFPPNYSTQTSGTIDSVFFHETFFEGQLYSDNSAGSSSAPFSGLSPEYRTLLSSYGASNTALTLQLNMSGLTRGQDYLVQVWSNFSFFGRNNGMRVSGEDDSDNFVDLLANTTTSPGGLGQYAVGTFTAENPTLVLDLNGSSGAFLPTINAFQVRAVPEPSTYVLAGIGAALVGVARCRNRGRFTRWTAR